MVRAFSRQPVASGMAVSASEKTTASTGMGAAKSWMSLRSKRAFCQPSFAAFRRARSIMPSEMSTPSTAPFSPTRSSR